MVRAARKRGVSNHGNWPRACCHPSETRSCGALLRMRCRASPQSPPAVDRVRPAACYVEQAERGGDHHVLLEMRQLRHMHHGWRLPEAMRDECRDDREYDEKQARPTPRAPRHDEEAADRFAAGAEPCQERSELLRNAVFHQRRRELIDAHQLLGAAHQEEATEDNARDQPNCASARDTKCKGGGNRIAGALPPGENATKL